MLQTGISAGESSAGEVTVLTPEGGSEPPRSAVFVAFTGQFESELVGHLLRTAALLRDPRAGPELNGRVRFIEQAADALRGAGLIAVLLTMQQPPPEQTAPTAPAAVELPAAAS